MQWHAADARLLGQVRFHFRLIRLIYFQNGICLYSLLSSRADISSSFCLFACQVLTIGKQKWSSKEQKLSGLRFKDFKQVLTLTLTLA